MKKFGLCMIVWLLAIGQTAMAETVTVIGTQNQTVIVDTEVQLENLSIVVNTPLIMPDYYFLEAQERYSYVICPVTITNFALEAVNIENTIEEAAISYREKYVFEMTELCAEDDARLFTKENRKLLCGEWNCYHMFEGSADTQEDDWYKTYDIVIDDIREDGSMSVKWGDLGYIEGTSILSNSIIEEGLTFVYTPTLYSGWESYLVYSYDKDMIGGGNSAEHIMMSRKDAVTAETPEILDILETATYDLIFQVPNTVAEADGERVITFTIDGQVMEVGF